MTLPPAYIPFSSTAGALPPAYPTDESQCVHSENAVNFNGTNAWMYSMTGLSGISDGPTGSVSTWVKFNAGTTSFNDWHQIFGTSTVGQEGLEVAVVRTSLGNFDSQNSIGIALKNHLSNREYRFLTATAYPNGSGWINILASWDVTTGTVKSNLYINDVSDNVVNSGPGPGSGFLVDYEPDQYSVGSQRTNGGGLFDFDIAENYFTTKYIDYSIESERRKFYSAAGKPVFLGEDGSIPTESIPNVYFAGDTPCWHINRGTGGGFLKTGNLTTATTNPWE